jgi:AraC-like DNA-binding protein
MSSAGLATLVLAGRFPLSDQGFPIDHTARHTHALHLHGYTGRWRLADQQFELKAGDLTLTPAATPNRYDLDAPGHCWCVHFKLARATKLATAGLLNLAVHVSLGAHALEAERRLSMIAHLHGRALDEPKGRQEASIWSLRARLCFQDLLLWLAQLSSGKTKAQRRPSHANRAVERAAMILSERLTTPPTVPDLAEELELSQNYLAWQFRKRFGLTLLQYSLRRRIEYARNLLMTTDLPASKVGALVGMSDPRHFSKRFKSVTGRTPAATR